MPTGKQLLSRRSPASVALENGWPTVFRIGPHVGEPAQEMARPSSPEEVRRIEVFG